MKTNEMIEYMPVIPIFGYMSSLTFERLDDQAEMETRRKKNHVLHRDESEGLELVTHNTSVLTLYVDCEVSRLYTFSVRR